MSTNTKGKPVRSNVHLQGEGRPFSLARVKPWARVLRSPVLELVEKLELDDTTEAQLVGETCKILARYLGPKLLSQRTADHAVSLKTLERIASESAKLRASICTLQNEYLVEIEDHRSEPGSSSDVPKFDFLQLERTLMRLSKAAWRARSEFTARRRGAPKKTLLDEASTQFRELFEASGLEVQLHESGSKEQQRRTLDGRGGELLISLFQEFDRHTDESQLWGSWKRTRLSVGKSAERQSK